MILKDFTEMQKNVQFGQIIFLGSAANMVEKIPFVFDPRCFYDELLVVIPKDHLDEVYDCITEKSCTFSVNHDGKFLSGVVSNMRLHQTLPLIGQSMDIFKKFNRESILPVKEINDRKSLFVRLSFSSLECV